jgi:hypothetical protein
VIPVLIAQSQFIVLLGCAEAWKMRFSKKINELKTRNRNGRNKRKHIICAKVESTQGTLPKCVLSSRGIGKLIYQVFIIKAGIAFQTQVTSAKLNESRIEKGRHRPTCGR